MTVPGPQSSAPPLLEVTDLQVEFSTRAGTIRAVDGVSFELGEGETLAILGESGSGKSVTALSLLGLVPRPAGRVVGGSITYDGTDLLGATDTQLRHIRGQEIAMIFQDPLSSLNPVFTVGWQIGEMLRRHRGMSHRESRREAAELMDRVGIPAAGSRVKSFPHEFSGGMRQRVMIAMALSLQPRVLVADEPTTALDVTVQAQLMELLAQLQAEEGMSLVLITHDLGVVAEVADRAAVMYAGRIVETGPLRHVYQRHGHPYTLGLMESVPRIDTREDRLVPITGAPPDLLHTPQGCSFHPRCRFAAERCTTDDPVLEPFGGAGSDHRAACHFSEEVAADVPIS